MEEDLLALRDAALIALLGHRGVTRLVNNVLVSQKRWVDSKLTTDLVMEWIENSAEDTLCLWYVRDYYDLDVLELILDLRYGLVSGC